MNWIHNLPRDSKNGLILVNSAASNALPFLGQKSSFHEIVLEGNKININPILF